MKVKCPGYDIPSVCLNGFSNDVSLTAYNIQDYYLSIRVSKKLKILRIISPKLSVLLIRLTVDNFFIHILIIRSSSLAISELGFTQRMPYEAPLKRLDVYHGTRSIKAAINPIRTILS